MEKSREYDSYFTNIEIHTHLILKIHELLTFFSKTQMQSNPFFFLGFAFLQTTFRYPLQKPAMDHVGALVDTYACPVTFTFDEKLRKRFAKL